MKPNFPALVRKLESHGMTQQQIARQIKSSTSTVNRIKNDKQVPNYYLGERLIFISASIPEAE